MVQRLFPAEQRHLPSGLLGEPGGNIIVRIEYQLVAGVLVGKNIPLCRHILVQILVDIQVVRGQIGDHSNAGALLHGQKLERGQLQHHNIVGADLIHHT